MNLLPLLVIAETSLGASNKCADALDMRGVREENDFLTYDSPLLLLYLNKLGMYYDRHYVSNVQTVYFLMLYRL